MLSEIEVQASNNLACPLCHGPAYFAARIPHSMRLSHGGTVHGRRTVVLCPRCDRDNPATNDLLAFFVFHERITRDNVAQAAPLIEGWLRRSRQQVYSDDDQRRDIRDYLDGEM